MVAAGMLCALSMLAHAGEGEPTLGIAEGEALKRATLAPSAGAPVSIRVLPGDWGGADREDVENLLKSVARELWVYFPGRTLNSILVAPTERHPIAGYSKGPEGEYFVYLSAKGRHWSQYAYQFAHEFAHILSNYERHGRSQVRRNQWFDESLCETASLFTLRRLGASWLKGDTVPYPHWKTYGTAFQTYVQGLLAQPHRALPPKAVFAEWYQGNAAVLDRNPYGRERDELVAGMLLPLFEEHPEAWAAISYLNLEESDATGSFQTYLGNWHRNTPERQKPLVAKIIETFGFPVPGTPLASRNAGGGAPQSR
jgi:hypothetical protein